MSKKKLFEDIKQNPSCIYRTPADVLRDRRFADPERLEILRARRSSTGPNGFYNTMWERNSSGMPRAP